MMSSDYHLLPKLPTCPVYLNSIWLDNLGNLGSNKEILSVCHSDR